MIDGGSSKEKKETKREKIKVVTRAFRSRGRERERETNRKKERKDKSVQLPPLKDKRSNQGKQTILTLLIVHVERGAER